jgi:hypothetical protein
MQYRTRRRIGIVITMAKYLLVLAGVIAAVAYWVQYASK